MLFWMEKNGNFCYPIPGMIKNDYPEAIPADTQHTNMSLLTPQLKLKCFTSPFLFVLKPNVNQYVPKAMSLLFVSPIKNQLQGQASAKLMHYNELDRCISEECLDASVIVEAQWINKFFDIQESLYCYRKDKIQEVQYSLTVNVNQECENI